MVVKGSATWDLTSSLGWRRTRCGNRSQILSLESQVGNLSRETETMRLETVVWYDDPKRMRLSVKLPHPQHSARRDKASLGHILGT